MVRNSSVKWAPAMHRFGQKFDHAMLSATWRWRTKKTDKFEAPDYQAMDSQSWDRFDSHLRIKTQESTDAKTDTMHMQSDINAAGIDSAHAKTDIMHMQSDIRAQIHESVNVTGIDSAPEEITGHNGQEQSPVTEVQQDSSQEYRKLFLDVTETIQEVVPKKKKRQRKGRAVSTQTKDLFEKRTREYSKKAPTKEERRNWNKRITRACRKD